MDILVSDELTGTGSYQLVVINFESEYPTRYAHVELSLFVKYCETITPVFACAANAVVSPAAEISHVKLSTFGRFDASRTCSRMVLEIAG